MKNWIYLALIFLVPGLAPAAPPVINHVPVTKAARGVPVPLVCTVDGGAQTVTQVIAQVSLTDIGSPRDLVMERHLKGEYDVFVAASLIKGVNVFWYSLVAINNRGETTRTDWQRVVIFDGATEQSGRSFWQRPTTLIVGGGIAAGGVITAIIAGNNSGGGGGGGGGGGNASSSNPTAGSSSGGSGSGRSGSIILVSPSVVTNVPPPCIVTGQEQVSYGGLDPYYSGPIYVSVCRTCSNATVSATGSWGASDQASNFNNPDCNPEQSMLILYKPEYSAPPAPGTYTIEVRSNGRLIDSLPWPPQGQGPF